MTRRILPGQEYGPEQWLSFTSPQQTQPMDLKDLTGQYAVSEWIQDRIRAITISKDQNAVSAAIQASVALPDSVESPLWQYEHLRVIVAQTNFLCAELASVCTAETCPTMIATNDWEFLCAAHANKPKKCCAIDYILHTLTGFTALLNNNELFPNRLTVTERSAKYFSSIVRRLYRVYAHAYYHHRQQFDRVESKLHVCERFVALTTTFGLMDKTTFSPPIPFPTSSTASTAPPLSTSA
jgi:hypothetical protein